VDAGLFSTDFRSGERTAQLIVQVAGRAGRAERPGTVLLQTRHPDHPLLRQLLQNGYPGFASACLEERKTAGLPPYTHQALWRAEAPCKEAPQRFLESLEQLSRTWRIPALQILGPAPAPLARRAGRYRWQLLFQSHSRGILHAAIDRALAATATLPGSRTVRWSVDTDPADLY
jgi:primosomal protein N' (replication factor Y)